MKFLPEAFAEKKKIFLEYKKTENISESFNEKISNTSIISSDFVNNKDIKNIECEESSSKEIMKNKRPRKIVCDNSKNSKNIKNQIKNKFNVNIKINNINSNQTENIKKKDNNEKNLKYLNKKIKQNIIENENENFNSKLSVSIAEKKVNAEINKSETELKKFDILYNNEKNINLDYIQKCLNYAGNNLKILRNEKGELYLEMINKEAEIININEINNNENNIIDENKLLGVENLNNLYNELSNLENILLNTKKQLHVCFDKPNPVDSENINISSQENKDIENLDIEKNKNLKIDKLKKIKQNKKENNREKVEKIIEKSSQSHDYEIEKINETVNFSIQEKGINYKNIINQAKNIKNVNIHKKIQNTNQIIEDQSSQILDNFLNL